MAADLPPDSPPPAPPAAVARAPKAAEPIFVDSHDYHYTVNGNTLLPREKVVAAIQAGATPKEAVDELNKAYTQAGYFLIVIGGQVERQLVALTVLQGRIAELDAPDGLRPYLSGALNREDLTQNQLIRESSLADMYAARQGQRLKANFSPAKEQGGTKLTVTEEEIPDAKPWSAGLFFNNLSGRFSSRYTWGASGAVRPGGGVELTANWVQGLPRLTPESEGSEYRSAQVGASIVTPWGLYGVNLSQTNYQIGASGAPVFPAGNVQFGGLTGQQIVFADPVSRAAVNEALTWYSNAQNASGFDDFPIVDQRYAVASLGAAYNRTFAFLDKNSSFGASVTLQKGLSGRSGTFRPAEEPGPDPHFALAQGTVSVVAGLPYGLTAGVSINGQYTRFALPQSQQWILGGFGNLSAWLPAVIIGDSGALFRATVASPSWAWEAYSVNATAFAEAGISRAELRAAGDPYTRGLGDTGLSLTAANGKGTTLSLSYAWPVWYRNIDGAVRQNVDRERANLYFTLNQSF